MRIKDFTGMRFGKLVVIKLVEKEKRPKQNVGLYWKCQCDCGNIKDIPARCFHLKKHTKSCGCLRKRLNPNRFHKKSGESIKNSIIRSYKTNAKNNGHDFLLTMEEAEMFFQGNCFYCGCPPKSFRNDRHHYGSYTYNGIDRKDNDRGYLLDNCVSCCSNCNYRKNKMNFSYFINKIRKMYEKINSKI